MLPRTLLITTTLTLSTLCPPALAADVSVTLDFASPTGAVATRLHYGLNTFQIYDPQTTANATFRANVAYMNPGMVRVHSWDMLEGSSGGNGWIDEGRCTWDADKILATLANGAYGYGPTWLFNIPEWPSCLAPGGERLPEDRWDRFAAFAAEFVRIVNVEGGLGAHYWELPNEREDAYADVDAGRELGRLWKRAAAAMRAIDPTIEVGGPAFTHPWVECRDGFIEETADEIDFISVHSYAGDSGLSTPDAWDHASERGGVSDYLKDVIAGFTSRPVKVFHDEYNISWSGDDPRQHDAVGAVFDALAMASFAQSSNDGAMAWNDSDGWYGKIENQWGDFALRPSAHVYHLFNAQLAGPVVRSTTSDPGLVVPFAVAASTGYAAALINRSEQAQRALVTWSGSSASALRTYQVTDAGMSEASATQAEAAAGLTLPATSVTLVVLDGTASGAGGTGGTGGLDGSGGLPGTSGGGGSAGGAGSAGTSAGGAGGGAPSCSPPLGANGCECSISGAERCNQLDDDCDGEVDEDACSTATGGTSTSPPVDGEAGNRSPDGATSAGEDDEGCGCRATGSAPGTPVSTGLVVALALALAASRRRSR